MLQEDDDDGRRDDDFGDGVKCCDAADGVFEIEETMTMTGKAMTLVMVSLCSRSQTSSSRRSRKATTP